MYHSHVLSIGQYLTTIFLILQFFQTFSPLFHNVPRTSRGSSGGDSVGSDCGSGNGGGGDDDGDGDGGGYSNDNLKNHDLLEKTNRFSPRTYDFSCHGF